MNLTHLFLVSLLLATAPLAHAQSTALPVKLQGVLTVDNSTAVARVNITKREIVGTDRLVLVLDQDLQELRLVQVDADTNLVATLATSTRCVFLPDNLFAADLTFTALPVSNSVVNITGDGALQVRGSYTTDPATGDPSRLAAKLLGVINDPVNGNTDSDGAMFKGDLRPDGKGFDADEAGL